MTTLYLLTAITTWLYSEDIRYAVYRTEAECKVALDDWKSHTQFWPFSGGHGGLCTKKELTEDDVATYLRRSLR